MIPTMSESSINELWELARAQGLRLRVHRIDATAGHDDAVFVVDIADDTGRAWLEVRTKNIESGCAWIIDEFRKRR